VVCHEASHVRHRHSAERIALELVRSVGDRSDFPDNIYGYGIPDLWKAYQMSKE